MGDGPLGLSGIFFGDINFWGLGRVGRPCHSGEKHTTHQTRRKNHTPLNGHDIGTRFAVAILGTRFALYGFGISFACSSEWYTLCMCVIWHGICIVESFRRIFQEFV